MITGRICLYVWGMLVTVGLKTRLVIDELLKIKNLVFIMGNHDLWALDWFLYKKSPYIWLSQGGEATQESYKEGVPWSHIQFYQKARYYYLDNNRLFVHGGFDPALSIDEQEEDILIWDRELVSRATLNMRYGKEQKLTTFDEVYVGHTPTLQWDLKKPIHACEVWMMDTGAGWSGGVLTIMDIETKEIFQSDEVDKLYPGVYGRR